MAAFYRVNQDATETAEQQLLYFREESNIDFFGNYPCRLQVSRIFWSFTNEKIMQKKNVNLQKHQFKKYMSLDSG